MRIKMRYFRGGRFANIVVFSANGSSSAQSADGRDRKRADARRHGTGRVFAMAERQHAKHPYSVHFVASAAGQTATTSGAILQTRALPRVLKTDTVIVSGGPESAVRAAVLDARLAKWIRGAHAIGARVASVCSGAFVLAAAGLLDGLSAATHWSAIDRLAEFRPAARVDRNAIFVQQGRVWTSAGVTTGIDMALAMVEADNGREVADRIAGQLVLYVRRRAFSRNGVSRSRRSSTCPIRSRSSRVVRARSSRSSTCRRSRSCQACRFERCIAAVKKKCTRRPRNFCRACASSMRERCSRRRRKQ